MEPGELYWTMVEPHWERVSIYNGGQIFLREYALTPEAARNLLSAHWCQSEVCNGGLHQFFSNSTGVLAPEAAAGYEAIGMPGLGSVVRRAIEFFGPRFPREEEERRRALDSYGLTHPLAWDPFGKLNEEFFELLENEGGGWAYAADEYAKPHGP
jgi:hypothetical protein